MYKQLFLFLILSAAMMSCELYPQDEYEEYYVVESYLVANNQLPFIRLSTTSPADEAYEFEENAVNFAVVEVRLLEDGPGSDVEESFRYFRSGTGIFRSSEIHQVKPRRTYQLHISFLENDDIITAHTTIPDTFRVLPGAPDTIVYQSEQQLELTLTPSFYPGRQNIFVFSALAEDPVADNLTPLYADLITDSDNLEEDLTLLANNSSGIINEANFEQNTDGTITIKYPWLGIAFYEENRIVANTIDDNVYDFVRSQQVQLGGSTLSPGEIQNVIYHMEGGIGVFGSLASDTVDTYVQRPEF